MVKSLVVSRVSQLKQHGECTVILRSTNMPLYKLKISLGTKNKGPDLLGGKKTHTKKNPRRSEEEGGEERCETV